MKPLNREYSIDMLRGWAIIFMIIGHSIFFRYGLGNGFLNAILNFSNVFCYITFLFTFGVGLYYSNIHSASDPNRIPKIWKRIYILLLAYYVTATVSLWSYYPINDWNAALLAKESWRIITFNYYSSFTEYIPSFMIFSICFDVLGRTYGSRWASWF